MGKLLAFPSPAERAIRNGERRLSWGNKVDPTAGPFTLEQLERAFAELVSADAPANRA